MRLNEEMDTRIKEKGFVKNGLSDEWIMNVVVYRQC